MLFLKVVDKKREQSKQSITELPNKRRLRDGPMVRMQYDEISSF